MLPERLLVCRPEGLINILLQLRLCYANQNPIVLPLRATLEYITDYTRNPYRQCPPLNAHTLQALQSKRNQNPTMPSSCSPWISGYFVHKYLFKQHSYILAYVSTTFMTRLIFAFPTNK